MYQKDDVAFSGFRVLHSGIPAFGNNVVHLRPNGRVIELREIGKKFRIFDSPDRKGANGNLANKSW